MVDGTNLYTYCFNNPVNWVDPWGLEPNVGGSGGGDEQPNKGDLEKADEKELEKLGIVPEKAKGGKKTGRWDIYKDKRNGGFWIFPKGGKGEGERLEVF